MGVRFIRKAHVNDGKRDEAIAFTIDVKAHWEEAYGSAITWGFELGGDQGTMYGRSDHDSLADCETMMLASMNNEETSKLMNDGIGLFGPVHDKLVYTM